jgi:peptidyl-prolyl cis-trans isomerase SurA
LNTPRFIAAFVWIATLLPIAAPRAQLVDGVAAVVGDQVILLSEVADMARPLLARIQEQEGLLPPEAVRQLQADALQTLIDNMLIEEFAQRVGLDVVDADIDAAVAGIAREENVEVEEVYKAAAGQGMNREGYREELGRQITKMRVIQSSVRARVTITDDEVQELFEERYANQRPGTVVRARHLLLPWPPEATEADREAVREIAKDLRSRAIASGNMADLARVYSRAPSAPNGGLTNFREGEVSPQIAAVVFGQAPGEVTEVVETGHGANVFQIIDSFDPSTLKLEDVEGQLRGELLERKTMPEFEDWLKEMRENRYIEVVAEQLR